MPHSKPVIRRASKILFVVILISDSFDMNHQKRPEVTRLKVPIRDVVDREQIIGDEVLGGEIVVSC